MKLEFKDYDVQQASEKYFLPDYEEPTENKIAIFTKDRATSTGHIHWMENINQFKDFMLNIWFPVLTEKRDSEYYNFMERVKKILEDDRTGYKTIMELTESSILFDAKIVWIGTINELIHSDEWIPSNMRDHFNEEQPITDENRQEFIDFLRDFVWG